MPEPNTQFQNSLRKIFQLALNVTLALTLLAVLLKTQHIEAGDPLLMISLSATAGIFFLNAYIPVQLAQTIKPDLYATILYKILYIGSSVLAIGILFTLTHLNGAKEMLLIGGLTTAAATLFSSVLFLKNADNWLALKKPFIIAICALIAGGILFIRLN